MSEIDWHDLPKDENNCVTMDLMYNETLYNIRMLDELPGSKIKYGHVIDRILLAKKSSDTDWLIVYVHALNFHTQMDELIESKKDIYVDEDYEIVMIDDQRNDQIHEIAEDLLENLPDDVLHSNMDRKVSPGVMIRYFYQWHAHKKANDQMDKFKNKHQKRK